MKKEYIAPEIELLSFDAKDIVTDSTVTDPYETDNFPPKA